MRIGFFTDSYLPNKHGVQTSVDSFATKLEELGHEVTIYTTHSPGYKDVRPRVVRLKSVRVLKNPEMRFALPFIHEGDLAAVLKSKLDVVHAHSPFGIGILGKIISRHQRIPMVYTHHTDYVEYSKFYLKDKVVIPEIAKKITSWFSNISDGVIAPSEKIRKSLLSYRVKKSIFVLPTGVDVERFHKTSPSASKSLAKRLGIAESDKVVMFLGRVAKEKNIEFIIRAFARLYKLNSDARLLIVGSGKHIAALEKLAGSQGVAERVVFTGFLDESDKVPSYHLADVFAFASHTDTQGIVILEASASGLPVVALKDDAFAGMIKNNVNGFEVDADSESIFADKLNEIISSPALAAKMGKQSLKIAENFSELEQSRKLLEIYENLIKEKSKKHERFIKI